jgi:succinyl-CoA synthetase alpha subunit
MSIFVDRNTRVVVQGITGSAGSFHAEQMLEYGTKVVAGVTPGRGGTRFHNRVPVFHTVEQAVKATGANASIIFVPPPFAADAMMEAADAGVAFICTITEGIPVMDMVKVRRLLDKIMHGVRLLGPNCPGIITPGQCKMGIMPGHIHRPGSIGVVSRSGTLTYEAVAQLTNLGLGQSTAVGIGGDPVHGTDFIDCLSRFEADPETEGVIIIGEIGGNEEEKAAAWAKANMTKPMVGFIAGRTAPPGKRMGHAGAVISGGSGTAEAKLAAFRDAGITVCDGPHLLGQTMKEVLSPRKPAARKAAPSTDERARPAPAAKAAAAPKPVPVQRAKAARKTAKGDH